MQHTYNILRRTKSAAKLAASSKKSSSTHRTLEASYHKSAATLFTFAATFCSIIIETRYIEVQPKAHRSPTDLLWWSPNPQVTLYILQNAKIGDS